MSSWESALIALDKNDITEKAMKAILVCRASDDLLAAAKHAAMEWRLHGQLTDSCRVLEAAIKKAEGREGE